MSKKCPNIKDPETIKTIQNLKVFTKNDNTILNILNRNNNHPLSLMSNGEPSLQYQNLEKLFKGSSVEATHVRAHLLTNTGLEHLKYAEKLVASGNNAGLIDSNGELTVSYIVNNTNILENLKILGLRDNIKTYDLSNFTETKAEYVKKFEDDIKYLQKSEMISKTKFKLNKNDPKSGKLFLRSTNTASKEEDPTAGKSTIVENNKKKVEAIFKRMNYAVGGQAFKLVQVDFKKFPNYYIEVDYSLVSKAFVDRQIDMNSPDSPTQYSKPLSTNTKKVDSVDETARKIEMMTKSFPGTEVIIDGDMPSGTMGEISYKDGAPSIKINPREVQSDTVFHEYGHLFIDLLGGMSNPFIKRGRDLLKDSEVESRVISSGEYNNIPQEVLDKEILATAIGEEAVKLDESSTFGRWIKIFFNKLKLAIGLNGNVAMELAQQMLNNKVNSKEFQPILGTYTQYSKASVSSKSLSLQDRKLKEITNIILERVEILKSKYKKSKKTEFKKDIETLLKDLIKAKDAKGIVRYIDEVETLSTQVLERIENMNIKDIDGILLKNLGTFSGIFDMIGDVKQLLNISKRESKDLIDKHIENGHLIKEDNGKYTIVPETPSSIKSSIQTDLSILLSLSAKEESLRNSINNISSINENYEILSREFLVEQMSNSNQATTKIRTKYKELFIKEFNNNLGGRKKAMDSFKSKKEYTDARNAYVDKKLLDSKDEILEATKEHLRTIITTMPRDINGVASWLSDPKNLNNSIIGYVTKLLEEADFKANRALTDEEKDANLIYEEYKAYKGSTSNMKEFYSELLEKDDKGNPTGFLIGEYLSSGDEFNPTLNKNFDRIRTLRRTDPNHALIKMYDYLTNLSKLKDANLPEGYKLGRAFVAGTNANGVILSYTYKLPSIEKGGSERISEQGLGVFVKESLKDIYARDTSYTESGETVIDKNNNIQSSKFKIKKVLVDETGQDRQDIPIHFRANIKDKGQQSYDLMGIILADYHMSVNYKEKSAVRHIAEIALDVAKGSNVVKRSGNKTLVNTLSKNNSPVTIPGHQSSMFKVLNSIIQQRLYGISSIDMGDTTILGRDVSINKIANGAMKWVADTMLVGNVMAGSVNLTQGGVFNFIEGLSSGFYNLSDIIKANKLYWLDLKDIIDDASGKRLPSSITNLLIQHFNSFAKIEDVGKKFAHTNRIIQITNGNSLHFISNSTEHYIQATVMYAVLNSIKVKNNKGEEVSLIDAYEKKGNRLVLKDGFDVDINMEARVSSRIKEVIKQIHGNYDSQNLAMIQRYVGGKFVFMLRKWLVVGVQRRWVGVSTFYKDKADLDPNDIIYSEILEQDMEGYYTTAMRFVNGIKGDLLKLRLDVISNNWHELTDAERSNIRKTIMEGTLIILTLLAARILSGLAKDADDDEKEAYYRAAYLFRRLHGESMFYMNFNETLKILSTPAASISMMQNVSKAFKQLRDPFEEYKIGKKKGESKLKKRVYKLIPVASQIDRDIQEVYEWLEKEG